MASKKSTRVATPIFGSTTVDDLKVADVYEGDASSTASYNKYKTIVSTTADNIISGVKNRKLTDITSVIKPGADGLSIDKAAATRRIEQVAGMRLDPNSIAQKAINSKAVSDLTGFSQAQTKKVYDSAGQLITLKKNDLSSASGLFSFISDFTGTGVVKEIVDHSAELALVGAGIDLAVELGLPDAIDSLVSKLHSSKDKKEALIKSCERAAKNGDLDTLYKIKGYIGGAAMHSQVPRLVEYVLAGYEFPEKEEEDSNHDYQSIYDRMVGLFNEVDPYWVAGERNAVPCSKLMAFSNASEASLKVFTWVGAYRIEAAIAASYERDSIKNIARKDFTFATAK